MTARILVAGIGNIFFGDDGFGVEVAQRLGLVPIDDRVKVVDYGIRGMHLAYDMLEGFEVTVLVDAVSRGDDPGTVYVIDVTSAGSGVLAPSLQMDQTRQLDPHGMTPDAVLELVGTLGGDPGQVFVVGCEPADCDERIGLSSVVAAAVEHGITAVLDLVTEQLALLKPLSDQPLSDRGVT